MVSDVIGIIVRKGIRKTKSSPIFSHRFFFVPYNIAFDILEVRYKHHFYIYKTLTIQND